jgi:hypothetical protein
MIVFVGCVNRTPTIRAFGGARLYLSLTKQCVDFTNKNYINKVIISFNRGKKAR